MADYLKHMSPAVRALNADLLEPKVAETLTKRKRGRPEGELQSAIIQRAELSGWMVYHTFDSRRSAPGFPDLVMLRGSRIVVAELKAGKNTLTIEQDRWLRAWLDAGVQVYEWRAGDEDEIERVLL